MRAYRLTDRRACRLTDRQIDCKHTNTHTHTSRPCVGLEGISFTKLRFAPTAPPGLSGALNATNPTASSSVTQPTAHSSSSQGPGTASSSCGACCMYALMNSRAGSHLVQWSLHPESKMLVLGSCMTHIMAVTILHSFSTPRLSSCMHTHTHIAITCVADKGERCSMMHGCTRWLFSDAWL
eukprot:scaffold180072_cov23-Tisochrysis_lutea.AAC.3